MIDRIKRRVEIYESDFGRKFGWDVYLKNILIAELTDSTWLLDSQFWHEYNLTVLTDNSDIYRRMTQNDFWYNSENLNNIRYVNKKYGTECTDVLSGNPFIMGDQLKIRMRFLYVPVRLKLWDYIYSVLKKLMILSVVSKIGNTL